MALTDIMLDMFDGKATTEETAAKLFEAYHGKPWPAEFVNNAKEKTREQETDLKPCPFCGGPAVLTVRPGSRTMLHCDNTDCYAAWVRFTAYNNGDSDERTGQRLTAWWNRRAENGK